MKVRDIIKNRKQSSIRLVQWRNAKIKSIDKNFQHLIAKFGYMVQGVGSSDHSPSFMYTIGLTNQQRPEFIAFGYINHVLMNEVVARFKDRDPNDLLNGTVSEVFDTDKFFISRDDENMNLRVLMVKADLTKARKHAMGIWNPNLVKNEPVAIYQIFLADKNNLLPGEEGYVHYLNIPDLRPTIEKVAD